MITKEITPERIDIDNIVSTSIFVLLIILFFVSLVFFIKSWSRKQNKNTQKNINIEQKIDKIIDLLEKKEIDK